MPRTEIAKRQFRRYASLPNQQLGAGGQNGGAGSESAREQNRGTSGSSAVGPGSSVPEKATIR